MIAKDAKNHNFATSNFLQSFFLFSKKIKSERNKYVRGGGTNKMEWQTKEKRLGIKNKKNKNRQYRNK